MCLVLLLCPLVVFGHAEECALWKGRASLLLPAFVSRFQAENGGFYKDTTQTVSSNYWYSPHALHTVVRASYLGLLNKTDQALFLDKFFSFHDTEGEKKGIRKLPFPFALHLKKKKKKKKKKKVGTLPGLTM